MPREHETEYGEEVEPYNENPEPSVRSWDTRPEQRPRECISIAPHICANPDCWESLDGSMGKLCDDCKARREFEETNGAEYALLMQDNQEEEE